MKQALRTAQYLAISAMTGSLAAGAFSACSNDDSGGPSGPDAAVTPDSSLEDTGTAPHPDAMADVAVDAGQDSSLGTPDVGLADVILPDVSLPDVGVPDVSLPGLDSGVEAAVDAGLDAPIEAEASAQSYCATQSGLAFCADFDEPDSLWVDGGASSVWTSVLGTPTDLSISATHSTSAPDSLLMTAGQSDTPTSVKVVKEYSSTPVTDAIYEYDINVAAFPATLYAGGFATDFQFADAPPATDTFGFRIGVFNAQFTGDGNFSADFEHNADVATGGACGPCGTAVDGGPFSIPLQAGGWQHVKIVVAFSPAVSDAGAPGLVSVQLFLNRSTTATLDSTFPAPFAVAPFARISTGLADTWTSGNDHWEIYYDNVTLKVQ